MAMLKRLDPRTVWVKRRPGSKGPQARSLAVPWAVFLIFGIPFGLVAALGPLAMAGIYIEPLRAFWRPWPPDLWKPFIGLAGFAIALAYLAYRAGRASGFHAGEVAAGVAFRNMADARIAAGNAMGIPPPPEAPAMAQPPRGVG